MTIHELIDLYGGPLFATFCLAAAIVILHLKPARREMDLSNDNVLRSARNPEGRPRQVIDRPPAPAPMPMRRHILGASDAISKSYNPMRRDQIRYIQKWKGDFHRD